MGLQQNLEAIKLKGREEGREEGRTEERESVAINLIRMGMSDAVIVSATGISRRKLEELRKQIL